MLQLRIGSVLLRVRVEVTWAIHLDGNGPVLSGGDVAIFIRQRAT